MPSAYARSSLEEMEGGGGGDSTQRRSSSSANLSGTDPATGGRPSPPPAPQQQGGGSYRAPATYTALLESIQMLALDPAPKVAKLGRYVLRLSGCEVNFVGASHAGGGSASSPMHGQGGFGESGGRWGGGGGGGPACCGPHSRAGGPGLFAAGRQPMRSWSVHVHILVRPCAP